MNILIDGDACPVKEIAIKQAKQAGIGVIIFIDTSHEYRNEYAKVIQVDKGADSADIALANAARQGDIALTADYGVATMALAKGCRVLAFTGMEYTAQNIDLLLFERHIGREVRRNGGRTRGMKKRTPQDDERFAAALAALLAQSKQTEGE